MIPCVLCEEVFPKGEGMENVQPGTDRRQGYVWGWLKMEESF